MLEWINTLDKNLYFEARVKFHSMVSTFVCNFLITNKEPCKLDTKKTIRYCHKFRKNHSLIQRKRI